MRAYSLAIHPVTPTILLLGRDDGVYRSTDGGANWIQTNLALRTVQVSFAPGDPSRIYAAGDRFSISVDGGNTWKTKDLPGCTDEFNGFGISPDGKHLLLSADGQGMLRSDDSSATWRNQPVRTVLNGPNLNTLRAFGDGRVVAYGYPEAYETRNFQGWSFFMRGPSPLREVRQLEIHPLNQKLVFASASDKLARSTDGGIKWTAVRIPFEYYNGFALDPQDTNRLYIFQGVHVSTTTDGGASWTPLTRVPTQGLRFLIVHPTNARIIYAGTSKPNRGGLYRSTDGGRSWQSWSAGIKGDAVVQLVINPASSSVMYLLEEKFDPPISRGRQILTGKPKIYKTVNGGATWELKEQGPSSDLWPATLELDPLNPDKVYAGGYGVYFSENGGESWSGLARSGLPSDGTRFDDLLFSPINNRMLIGVSDAWGVFTYLMNP